MRKSIFRNSIIAGVLIMASLSSCKEKEPDNTDAMNLDTSTTTVDTASVKTETDTAKVNPDTVMGP